MSSILKYTVIKDLKQYNNYCDIHEELMKNELDNLDELELLEVLIEEFDNRTIAEAKKRLAKKKN